MTCVFLVVLANFREVLENYRKAHLRFFTKEAKREIRRAKSSAFRSFCHFFAIASYSTASVKQHKIFKTFSMTEVKRTIAQDYTHILENEETLDPQDWQTLRTLAHKMVDDAMDYLETVGERPVWTKTPEASKALSQKRLPTAGTDIEDIYDEFRQHIMPYTKGNIHPRFFAWVQGTGTAFGALADMLASVMNPNTAIGDHSAMYIDKQVVDWCKEMFDFPSDASGILVSGGSVANITGITIARNAFDATIRQKGIHAAGGQMTMYGSVETHSCVQKAAEVVGIGNEYFRRIPVDAQYQIDLQALRKQIEIDIAAGLIPFCIVGNAGTVNTGAIDPLSHLLDLARELGLWFHVDGAFGALAYLIDEYKPALRAITEADSLAFDLHKWLYMPYEIGCILVKSQLLHRTSFGLQPNYLLSHERGLAAGPDPITNYGLELSRGFKALKAWFSFKEHGSAKYARLIRQNIAQCFYLGSLIEKEPLLELLTPVTMNIVCFRFNPQNGLDTASLNQLNKEILMRLHEDGIAAPSYTLLDGRYAIRVANVNHRSRKSDFEALVAGVLSIGQDLV
jgi:glutamate/tyrosine decarboxylase-like PLP-dependent enzyme